MENLPVGFDQGDFRFSRPKRGEGAFGGEVEW